MMKGFPHTFDPLTFNLLYSTFFLPLVPSTLITKDIFVDSHSSCATFTSFFPLFLLRFAHFYVIFTLYIFISIFNISQPLSIPSLYVLLLPFSLFAFIFPLLLPLISFTSVLFFMRFLHFVRFVAFLDFVLFFFPKFLFLPHHGREERLYQTTGAVPER